MSRSKSKDKGMKNGERKNPWSELLGNTCHADIARELSTEEAPITRAAVHTWFHGEHHPDHDNKLRIIEVYGKAPPEGLGVTLLDVALHYDLKRKEKESASKANSRKGKGRAKVPRKG